MGRRGAPHRLLPLQDGVQGAGDASRTVPNVRWNGGTNWPIGCGHPCIGCAEPDFWDSHDAVLPAPDRACRASASHPTSTRSARSPSLGVGAAFAGHGLIQIAKRVGSKAEPIPPKPKPPRNAERRESRHEPRRRRSRHPHRRAPPDRGRSRRRRRPRRVVVVDDVPRHRAHPEGARPARCVGVHAAHLRRVHDRPRDRVDPRGRECHRRGAAAQRAAAAQPDHRRAVRAGSRRPLLPPARARLGRHRVGAVGRSREDLVARRNRSPTGRCRARSTSRACAIASRDSSIAASSARSPTRTGGTRPTGCRRKPT